MPVVIQLRQVSTVQSDSTLSTLQWRTDTSAWGSFNIGYLVNVIERLCPGKNKQMEEEIKDTYTNWYEE